MKNRSYRPRIRRTKREKAKGGKAKNRNKRTKGKTDEGDKDEDDAINRENQYQGGRGARKERRGSDKVSNRKQASADTMDLFTLQDFLDDDKQDMTMNHQ